MTSMYQAQKLLCKRRYSACSDQTAAR